MSDNKERCNFKTSEEKIGNYKYKERVILIYLYKKYNGNYLKVYDALINGEKIDVEDFYRVVNETNFKDYITLHDTAYDKWLKDRNIPVISKSLYEELKKGGE